MHRKQHIRPIVNSTMYVFCLNVLLILHIKTVHSTHELIKVVINEHYQHSESKQQQNPIAKSVHNNCNRLVQYVKSCQILG